MKTFYYKKDSQRRRTYGGLNVKVSLYGVKNREIIKLGSCEWCTASYRGDESEVFNALVRLGQIPKKWLKSSESPWSSGGYFIGDVEKHYKIKELI